MNKKSAGMIVLTLIFINTFVTSFSTTLVFTEAQDIAGEQVDAGTTELIIGVNRAKPNSYEGLRDLTIDNGGKIVNKVSIKGKVIALVVELPLIIASSLMEDMKAAGLATYVEPRRWVEASFVPNDAHWTAQWGPKKIEAGWAWNYTTGSDDLLIAVLDTGIDYNHQDLADNYVSIGYDWVNNDTDPKDDNGHGTHVAGIIAAVTNNSIGVAGLAQVQVMAEKVMNNLGQGKWDWVANGIINATDAGADIISMSLGGDYYSPVGYQAVQYAYNNGVLLVAAAGNHLTNRKHYPAAYEKVIAVAATDENDDPAKEWPGNLGSNFGDWIEVAAPGDDIYSTLMNDTYGYKTGTSMACPHVAGLAALIWSRYPHLTRDSVRYLMRYTADDLGLLGFDSYYGYGRINAHTAVKTRTYDYDLVALGLDVPPIVEAEAATVVKGTVLNLGSRNQTNVNVTLLENDNPINHTTISSLPSGNSSVINFSWTPTLGEYNLTLNVTSLAEVYKENNVVSKNVEARFPTVLSVPSEYSSIQAALNEAVPKDTINVSAGTYNESIFIHTADVKLIGEGSGSTTIQGVVDNPFAINIGANNVTVSGFSILGNRAYRYGIEINAFTGINISLNRIESPFSSSHGVSLVGAPSNIIARNNINSYRDGIYLKDSSNHNVIHRNNITSNNYNGIKLLRSSNNEIFHNTVSQSYGGISTHQSPGNKISHNNFINNTVQVFSNGSMNAWDAGYPLGGNYWSEYTGTDNYSGPHQNETGSDGIGDTTYIINENNQDSYPLIEALNPGSEDAITVTKVTPSPVYVTHGKTVQISAVVKNHGDFNAASNVTAYAYNTTEELGYNIGTLNATFLAPSQNVTLLFNWNTTAATQNITYTIRAEASSVPHETNTTDNTYIDGTVLVRLNDPPLKPLKPYNNHNGTKYAGQTYTFSTITTDPNGDNMTYTFDWGDNTNKTTGEYRSNVTASASHAWVNAGTYNVSAQATDLFGDRSSWSENLTVTISSPYGGGCPFIYSWNGTDFVIDNNLLPESAGSNGTEVEDYYRLEQNLVPVYEDSYSSYYSLLIGEFQQEHSFFDEVQLFVVDHGADVNAAVSPTGEILTYQNPYAPLSAVDGQGTSWLQELNNIDGNYYEGYNSSYLILNFGEVTAQDAKLVMRADRPPTKKSIHIQVLNTAGNWVDVVSIIPRTYWATEIVNLSSYLPPTGEFKVRLYFTDSHKIDFVGLDTTTQAQIDLEQASLVLAYHSNDGDVTTRVLSDDDVYAELLPEQQIALLFAATTQDEDQRTFIIYLKGYYYTITS